MSNVPEPQTKPRGRQGGGEGVVGPSSQRVTCGWGREAFGEGVGTPLVPRACQRCCLAEMGRQRFILTVRKSAPQSGGDGI